MSNKTLLLVLAIVALMVGLADSSSAQRLWAVDGPGATVNEFTGPPAGPCAYPNGPAKNSFPYNVPFPPCPTAGPFLPGVPVGDVTVDMFADRVWVTDGTWVTGYTKSGLPYNSFMNPLNLPITGLGWGQLPGAAGGVLWITDGMLAAAVTPPVPPGCGGVVFAVPPFPLVITPPPATDIDWDPSTGTLFLSSAAGVITNEVIGGGPGPFGVFAPPCGLAGLFLDGLAVDKSTFGRLYVTDGISVAYALFGGAPAPPTFYTTASCFPVTGPTPVSGLAFDATPIGYGSRCDPAGLVPPFAKANSQAVSPNGTFALQLLGAVPGSQAFLLLGTGAACPPVPYPGCPILVFPFFPPFGPFPVPGTGTVVLPAAIPAGFGGTGASAYLQWFVFKPAGGGLQTTQGLELTLAAP